MVSKAKPPACSPSEATVEQRNNEAALCLNGDALVRESDLKQAGVEATAVPDWRTALLVFGEAYLAARSFEQGLNHMRMRFPSRTDT
jgi:hypothetical protein